MLRILHAYIDWIKTWKALPVRSWIAAAESYRAGQYEEAANLYRKGLVGHPNHVARHCARLDLAYCLFRVGKYAAAKEELAAVIHSAPKLREGYIRLARLQLWIGQTMEAAWTLRRALRAVGADPELVASYVFAILDNGGPTHLLKEALSIINSLDANDRRHQKIEVAFARLAIHRKDLTTGKAALTRLANSSEAPFESVVAFADLLLSEGKVAQARQQLRRALAVAPNHPRVLSLLATSYLQSGQFYNPDFARQLAISACQSSGWVSPKEMHVLAEAYFSASDRLSALSIAIKAKEAGSKLLGNYRHVGSIDRLIESLSSP
jgi:tetratricopeptide (TPR) repeat protein